jgi:PPM family protein phosphatase
MILMKNDCRPYCIFSKTDIGNNRTNNEDSVATIKINTSVRNKELEFALLVVADGMGGLELGEVASDIAINTFMNVTTQHVFHLFKKKEQLNFKKILHESFEVANEMINKISNELPNKVGTTMVSAIISNNHVYIGNLGDSRAYFISPSKSIKQLTKDHSVVQEMVDAKVITPEQAKIHPRRNILTKALGLEKTIQPDLFEYELNDNILLLCSDGLHGVLSNDLLIKSTNFKLERSAEKLISLALKHGSQDNISVALGCRQK